LVKSCVLTTVFTCSTTKTTIAKIFDSANFLLLSRIKSSFHCPLPNE
jgi:hypothetical protein